MVEGPEGGGGRPPTLSRELVLAARRERLIEALAELCLEQGYRRTTVADTHERAGVSRTSFYEVFSNQEDSFAHLIERAGAEMLALLDAAETRAPAGQVAAALEGAMGWAASHEAMASALLFDAPVGPLATGALSAGSSRPSSIAWPGRCAGPRLRPRPWRRCWSARRQRPCAGRAPHGCQARRR